MVVYLLTSVSPYLYKITAKSVESAEYHMEYIQSMIYILLCTSYNIYMYM